MRWLYLVVFVGMHAVVFAQTGEVIISPRGVEHNIDKGDNFDKLEAKVNDSLKSITQYADLKNNPVQDSLYSLQQIVEGQKVLSQKQWRHFYDSMLKTTVNNPLLSEFQKQEVSEEELLNALNKKFQGATKDSVLNVSKELLDKSQSLKNKDLTDIADVDAIPTKLESIPDVSNLKLPVDDLKDLSPLPASIIKSKYLTKLDSIRDINLANERLKLTEKKISSEQIITDISPKPSFWDKTYFEGVIGFSPGDFQILQISPTMGYHFSQFLSAGLGPNILVQKQDKSIATTVGVKTFFKAEFLKRQAYFQMEDIMDSYGTISSEDKNRKIFEQHNVFVGGGFLLSIDAPFTLNFSVLYCVTENKMISHEFSPMVFRIGFSSIKTKN